MIIDIPFIYAFYIFLNTQKRYKFSYGGRGGGKSIQIGICLLILTSSKKIRVLCTREIQKSIKESVHTILKELIEKYNFKNFAVYETRIVNVKTGSEFIFAGLRDHTVDSIKSYEGIDICWVEEAHTITERSLSILTPTIRKKGSEIWFSYNRKSILDPVHDLMKLECTKELNKKFQSTDGKIYKWKQFEGTDGICIFINFDGNPYFPDVLEKERIKDKERNYDLYIHKWLGEPENQSSYSLIKITDLMQAINREVDEWNYVSFGVDPARFGDDESVICIREGFRVMPLLSFDGIDTMELCGRIINKAKEYYSKGYKNSIDVKVDDTGIGSGVTDRLTELQQQEKVKAKNVKEFNINVIPVNFGGVATDNKYRNYGTEIWGNIVDALKTISLPDDDVLKQQLISRKYEIESDGRIKLESKKKTKKENSKSPDRADALALCLAESMNSNFEDSNIFVKKR